MASHKKSKLQIRREKAGLTQTALGAAIGRHPGTVSKAENPIGDRLAADLADALGCEPRDILG